MKIKGSADTVLIYNPYFPVYATSQDGRDTFRACPASEVISFDEANRLAAGDCMPIEENIFSNLASPTPAIQMYKHITQAQKSSSDSLKGKRKSGIAVVEFKLDINGKVVDVSIHRSLDPSRDKEAMSIIASMPNWLVRERCVKFRHRILLRF